MELATLILSLANVLMVGQAIGQAPALAYMNELFFEKYKMPIND